MARAAPADTVEIYGKFLRCPHCGNDRFTKAKALLNTKWMTLFNWDALNREATTYTCDRCGRVEWFTARH